MVGTSVIIFCMERGQRSPAEIRRIADRAQERSIETKKQRGEALLPEELELENRKAENAAARAEYRKEYPSFDTFDSAVRSAANELAGIDDENLNKAAQAAAENHGLLRGITNDALRGGVITAILAAHISQPELARAASLTVYTPLVKWLMRGDV